jgi:hypothetical protein
MEVDMRDYINDKCKAYLYSDSQVLLELPTMSYGFTHNHVAYHDNSVLANNQNAKAELVRNTLRTQLIKNARLQKKYVLLQFSEHLTNEPYSPNASVNNGMIEIGIVPVISDFTFQNIPMRTTVGNIIWRVGIVEDERRTVANPITMTVEDKLAAALRGMNVAAP